MIARVGLEVVVDLKTIADLAYRLRESGFGKPRVVELDILTDFLSFVVVKKKKLFFSVGVDLVPGDIGPRTRLEARHFRANLLWWVGGIVESGE